MADTAKPSYAEDIAEVFIAGLKNGTAPWMKPWEPGPPAEPPRNALTGKPYQGINNLMLIMMQNLHPEMGDDPRWCTYKQAQELGAQVKKGSKSTVIQYWKREETRLLRDENGKPILDQDGEKQYVTIPVATPRPFYARVFHASQIENMPPLPKREMAPQAEFERHERSEKLLAASGARIIHDQPDRAFYSSAIDEIHLPKREQFKSPDSYYATALHELGHWTGHESRLNRDLGNGFGTESYAKEELRAEIASYMLGRELGIGHDPSQHQAYVASWIKSLENDPKEIIHAARDANDIKDYIFGLERDRQVTQEQQAQPPVQEAQEATIQAPTAQPEPIHEPNPAATKTYLNVPYKEKNEAKKYDARWDADAQSWYAPPGTDLTPLQKWMPENQQEQQMQSPAMASPQTEFGDHLRAMGLNIEGEPVMDGKIHRVPVMGGRPGSRDGAYCGYADGRPNGWGQNYRTGQQEKWLATGHQLTPEARTALRQQRQDKLADAEAGRREAREKGMKRAYAQWMNAEQATPEHPYLQKKGVQALGLRQDKHGNLLVPGYNLETGRLQTLEHINQEGQKWYEKDCSKKGAVGILPDKDALKSGSVVLMVEGYATGASVHEATGLPVAIAFDAGNIKEAAMAIKRKLPNVNLTICADNDAPRISDSKNIGVVKAKEAAAAVGAKVVVADFSKNEKERGLTDFNDLHQARGLQAVRDRVMGNVRSNDSEAEL